MKPDTPNWEDHPELEEMAKLLDEADAEERSVLEAAALLEDAPGLDRVEATLEQEWSAAGGGKLLRGWLRVLLPLAAAAIVVTGVVFFQGDGDGDRFDQPSGQMLGATDGPLELVHPLGEVTDWTTIEWLPLGARVKVTVRDLGGEVVFGPQSTMKNSITLDSDVTDKWPDHIIVVLEAQDPLDQMPLLVEVPASLKRSRE